jgi:hypothetical protein
VRKSRFWKKLSRPLRRFEVNQLFSIQVIRLISQESPNIEHYLFSVLLPRISQGVL